MEPNSIEPHPANSKLIPAIVAGVVIAALVAGGGVYAYEKNQNDTAQASLQSQIDSLKMQVATKPSASPPPIATASPLASAAPSPTSTPSPISGTVFRSTLVNLSFTYPSKSSYGETEPLKSRESQGLKEIGHQVYFSDKNKLNPNFDATTADFTAQDSVPHDLLVGTLDTKSSFSIASFEKTTMVTTEVSPGIFQATAYGNQECSAGISSYLFVRPPQNSGLKYISFYLGGDTFLDSEIQSASDGSACTPKPDAKTRRITALNASTAVTTTLNEAVAISKTFTVK